MHGARRHTHMHAQAPVTDGVPLVRISSPRHVDSHARGRSTTQRRAGSRFLPGRIARFLPDAPDRGRLQDMQ
jgi:hypothetical protein